MPTKKKAIEKRTKRPDPKLQLYRRIAVTFVTVTSCLLVIVLYLSLSKATIRVVAEPQILRDMFIVHVVQSKAGEMQILGAILSQMFERAQSFQVDTQAGTLVEAKAGGEVTIFNTYSTDQPLVATTRLLSPDGILFRIDEYVVVPSGGQVTVMVHADEPGPQGEVGPTRFTIPGLSTFLQEKIYAQSDEAFTGGLVTSSVVIQEQLDQYAEELLHTTQTAAEQLLTEQSGQIYSGVIYIPELLERKSDTAPGEETDQVTISLTLRLTAVFYDQEALIDLVTEEVMHELPDEFHLLPVQADALDLTVERSDESAQTAQIRVDVETPAILSSISHLLRKDQFLGKTASQVIEELEAYDLIKSVDVRFRPFWLKRIPTLQDHIEVEVE